MRGPLTAIGLAVVLALLDRFFALWLSTWLWVFAIVVDLAVTAVALVLVVVAVRTLLRRSHRRVAATATVVVVAVLAAVVLVDWPLTFARGWFALHRSDFAEVAAAGRAGAYGPLDRAPYGGYDLPGQLGLLSVDGAVAVCGSASGQQVLVVPAFLGIPDGGAGFVHLPGPPDGPSADVACDEFGGVAHPRVALGNGWWWTG